MCFSRAGLCLSPGSCNAAWRPSHPLLPAFGWIRGFGRVCPFMHPRHATALCIWHPIGCNNADTFLVTILGWHLGECVWTQLSGGHRPGWRHLPFHVMPAWHWTGPTYRYAGCLHILPFDVRHSFRSHVPTQSIFLLLTMVLCSTIG